MVNTVTCRQSEAIEASMLESRVTDDTMVGGGRGRRSLETEEMEEEEEESEETLKKARDWDEFKDGMFFMHMCYG